MSQPSPPSQPPLLREVIHIPERTSTSDFVLKLTEGVSDAEATLRDYVITEPLVRNFDEALGLIQSALASGSSKAAYLHGSFGSGKSHFMAVLHAVLRGEQAARRRDELAGLLARHDPWMSGRRFLLVPYHLLGAKSLEQAVLGGYVDHVRRLHPDAPVPAVHRTDALLADAQNLRGQIGDERFIEGLPGGNADDEWGESEPFWDSARLDAALGGAYDDTLRRRLVSDLLTSWFRGFLRDARESAEGFISLDRGLTEISRHARQLGYDGLVLFLDELVLWLASSIGDQQFVAREAQKVTNFVEGGDARRPVPVVSFIARQRDLRELVGEEVTGAIELSFQDTLNLASGRFDVITLEDRNLPVIAHERLLKPVGEAAAAAIAEAFDSTTRLRRDVWDALLGTESATGADIDSFRASYPFSPAFMDTLVHVSSALQRSRTALKLMRQILVDHRDDLRLSELVPLGDLYEVISRGGDQPFTEKLKIEFETAQKLYETKLRPHLLHSYGLSDDDVERSRHGAGADGELAERVRAFTGDDRLLKTLLLSALAPSVPALRNLTASRLSALNHGSIRSPIPRGEVSQVGRKVQEWASRFGEVKFTQADDPGVALELIGVDVDSVLASARHYDHPGARKQLVKRLLWEELGISASDKLLEHAEVVWRGSRRSVEMLYGNVRDEQDVRDDAFHSLDPSSWRVIVDHPFDEGDHGPADDRQRVQTLRMRGVQARTVCWVPAALTAERLTDLRRLVIIDAVLSGQRFETHAQHLNPSDRQRARATLQSQRDALLAKVRSVLRQAYGLAAKHSGDVVLSYEDHLLTLMPDLRLTLPVGAAMKDALHHVAGQLLAYQYPAHPDFDPDRVGATVRPADARMVLDYVRRAIEAPEPRVEVDRRDRATMRRIANPLQLGEMHEAAFVLGRHWVQHFHQQAAQRGIEGDLKVSELFGWLDEPTPRGLEPLVAHLVIACFAEQSDRAWVLRGGVLDPPPELAAISADLVLREQRLPSGESWQAARRRAMEVFGLNTPELRRGRLVGIFARQLAEHAQRYRGSAHRLVEHLEQHAAQLGLGSSAAAGRLHTARAAADLLDGISARRGALEVVDYLARADLGGPAPRTGRSVRSAERVADALATAPWDTFDLVRGLGEPYAAEAAAIFAPLRRAAQADELTVSLPESLEKARAEATELLRKATTRTMVQPPPETPEQGLPPGRPEHRPGAASGGRRATPGQAQTVLEELRAFLEDHPEATVEITWRVVE
jgi:hypothetical protein